MTAYCFEPIGRIRSCFTEKFGVPRQPGLVAEAEASIEIAAPYNQMAAFRGLDRFSHIWVLFVFHQCHGRRWHPTVRPPRLGGNQRVGVFASRSGFRPNTIGQSAVRLLEIVSGSNGLTLKVAGADLLDETPVLDIKPYLTYADSISRAVSGYAPHPPAREHTVRFSDRAEQTCAALDPGQYPHARRLITGILAQDPRPAYQNETHSRIYGLSLWDLNIRFQFHGTVIEVLEITTKEAI